MALAAVASLLAWLAGGAAVLYAARDQGEQLHDARLEDVARVILQFASHEIGEINAERPGDVIHLETARTLDERYRYQVWSKAGTLLLMSSDTPPAPFAPLDQAGHSGRTVNGAEYRVFTLSSPDGSMLIQVAERVSLRDHFVGTVDRYLVLFFAVTTAALVALNWWMFGRAARPFDSAARQLRERTPENPRAIEVDDPPRELEPMLDALNALFRRFDRALGSERHFTSAAAHELRTALAAVRVQAQVAERAKPKDVHNALRQLGLCVDRASRLVEQLLTLARLDAHGAASSSASVVRLEALASRIVAELTPLLRARGINVAAELKPVNVIGLEFGLTALVRNLVDNAARYCSPQGTVRVETREMDGHAIVAVDDSGPGIAPEERGRVFEPFYRLDSTDTEGSGVGLSIVQSVAAAHGGHVVLADSELGGLRVTVYLSLTAAHGFAPPAPSARPTVGQ